MSRASQGKPAGAEQRVRLQFRNCHGAVKSDVTSLGPVSCTFRSYLRDSQGWTTGLSESVSVPVLPNEFAATFCSPTGVNTAKGTPMPGTTVIKGSS